MDEGRKCKTVGPSEGRGRLKEVNLIKKTYKEREKNRMRQKQDKNIRTEWNKGKYKDTRYLKTSAYQREREIREK